MQTYFIAKDSSNTCQEVAHLYEHWFIASFHKFAENKLGLISGTFGYTGGETYNNIVFIEMWFYHKRVAELFEHFAARETLDKELLDVCIRQCAAEDREIWSVKDSSELTKQLAQLKTSPWVEVDGIAPYEYDDTDSTKQPCPITNRKSASSYKAVTISLNLKQATIDEKAVFLRFAVIAHDIVSNYIQLRGWYRLNTLSARDSRYGMYSVVGVSLPKSDSTSKQVKQAVEKLLGTFDVAANMPYIRAHFEEFVKQPTWKGRPRDDLHHSNVIVGNSRIARLATQGLIQRIISKLDVTVKSVPFAIAKELQD